MPLADDLGLIQSEGMRLAEAARKDPGRAVPQYPGWDLADLASHVASIHGRTVAICRDLPQKRISAPRLPDGTDPIDWYVANLQEMIKALATVDLAAASWAFGPNQVVGFWATRMLVETGVHRWDAEQAIGEPGALLGRVAEAGLDEFAVIWLAPLGDVQPLRLAATDLARTWTYGEGEPQNEVEGSASDIYLRLASRPSAVNLPDDWSAAVDSLAPPPKR